MNAVFRRLADPKVSLFACLAIPAYGQIASIAYLWLNDANTLQARPWTIFEHAIAALSQAPGSIDAIGAVYFLLALLSPFAVLFPLWKFLFQREASIYGDARWASAAEQKRAALQADKGLVLGTSDGKLLVHDGPAHVLVSAPTRSGKGVGLVIPNLLTWTGSVIVLDIKQENFTKTSGYRAIHQDVFLWSPADSQARSHRYNPLDTVRSDPRFRVADLQQVAQFLIPTPDNTDPMWAIEARDLFMGVTLYILDAEDRPKTLGEVLRLLKSGGDLADVLRKILDTEVCLDPACTMSLRNFIEKADKERSGVKSTLTAALNVFSNPMVDSATHTSDFDLRDLRRKPMSIYVGVSLNQLATLRPLLSLFFQQCVDVLSRQMPGPDERHKVLMLIDEFAAVGRMEALATGLPFLGGYNVRTMLVIQGLSHLDEYYGKAGRDSILQNTAIQVFFAANDLQTARYVSNRIGTSTVKTKAINQKVRSSFSGSDDYSETVTSAARPLLLPEEVQRLDKDSEIVFVEQHRPVLANKIRYYKSNTFKSRVVRPAPVPDLPAVRLDLIERSDSELPFTYETLTNLVTCSDGSVKNPFGKKE